MAEPEQQHNQCLTGVVITADEDLNSPACPGVTELMAMAEPEQQHNQCLTGVVITADEDLNSPACPGVTELMMCAFKGHSERVHELLLENPARLHVKNNNGVTVLDYAVSNKQVKVVDVLFAHNADLDGLNSNGYNILHRCVLSGQSDKVKLCIEMGAHIDCRSENNETALILAAKNGHVDIVKYLVSVVCDLNIKDNEGFDALEYAFFSDNSEIQQILNQASQCHNWPDTESGRRLILASENGDEDSVEALVSQFGEEIVHFLEPSETSVTAFHVSCMNGHLSIAQFLLENGANIHERTISGETALTLAAHAGHAHIVHWLIQKGSLVNCYSLNTSALCVAIGNDHRNVVETLVEAGAILNAVYQDSDNPDMFVSPVHGAAALENAFILRCLIEHGAYGDKYCPLVGTPLGIAAVSGNLECLKYLVEERRFDINKSQGEQCTPLMFASAAGNLEPVKYLVQHGADVNLMNNDRNTALDLAISENHTDISNFLMDKMGISYTVQGSDNESLIQQPAQAELLVLCKRGCESQDELVRLMNAGANINLQTEDGKTPLLTAIIHHNKNCAIWLLQKEADVNKQDLSGMTALMYATELGYADMVELLLDYNANVSIKDRNGRDVIAMASSQQDQHILELIENHLGLRNPTQNKELALLKAVGVFDYEQCAELLNNNVDVNFVDINGNTALSLCVTNTCTMSAEITRLLCTNGADLQLLDSSGTTPLQQCMISGNVAAFKILLQHGALTETNLNSTLLHACLTSTAEIMDIILEHFKQFKTKQISHYLELGLQLAVTNGQTDMAEYFHKKVLKTLCSKPVLVQIAQAASELVPENYGSFFSAIQDEDYPLIIKMMAAIPDRIRDKIRDMIEKSKKKFSSDDTQVGLWLALTSGHYEAALTLTPHNQIVTFEKSVTRPSPVIGYNQHWESLSPRSAQNIKNLWKETLDGHLSCIRQIVSKKGSSAICGISRNCDKTVVFIHTLESTTDEGHLLKNIISHHDVLRWEIVQQNCSPTELYYQESNLLQRQQHKENWMSISVQHSNRGRKPENVYFGQVGCFLKDISGTIWAVAACFNSKPLNLGPKCATGVQQRCSVTLFMPKLESMESNDCLSYFSLDIERTPAVKIAAVCLSSLRGVTNLCLLNPYVYSGENDIMLGRTVTILADGVGQMDAIIVDVNVSFQEKHGNCYHGVFVVSSLDQTKAFLHPGDVGAVIADKESGVLFGLVVATQNDYFSPLNETVYKNIYFCVRLDECLQYLFDRWNLQLGTLREF